MTAALARITETEQAALALAEKGTKIIRFGPDPRMSGRGPAEPRNPAGTADTQAQRLLDLLGAS